MIHKMQIVQGVADYLDAIEGDFTQKDLKEALEILKKYPYVCDKEINDGMWRKQLAS